MHRSSVGGSAASSSRSLSREAAHGVRWEPTPWAVFITTIAMLTLCGFLAGCARSTPPATPTLSPLARLIVGKWVVKDGHLAKTQIILGQEVEFQADGRYTWGKQEGSWSLFGEQTLSIHSAYGEEFSYTFTLEGDTLSMSRGTNCGKEDLYVLERAK